jgi:hypothetical protein
LDRGSARCRAAVRTTQTQNKHIQTSMPQVGFEPMVSVFEQVKTVRALDRATTLIGFSTNYLLTNRERQVEWGVVWCVGVCRRNPRL